MEFPKIIAVIGGDKLDIHSNYRDKNHVRLSMEQCQALESHLAAGPTADQSEKLTALQTKFDALQKNYDTVSAEKTALNASLVQALEKNGLTAETENATSEESIILLGDKCHEYGNSQNRHSFAKNDGKTPPENGLIDNVVDMNDAHNQIDL